MNEWTDEWTIKFNQISIVGCCLDQVCKLDLVFCCSDNKKLNWFESDAPKSYFLPISTVKIDTIASNLGFCSPVRTPHLALLYFYVNAAFITSSYSERKNTLKALRHKLSYLTHCYCFIRAIHRGVCLRPKLNKRIKDNVCVA